MAGTMNKCLATRTFLLLTFVSVAGCSPSVKPVATTPSTVTAPAGPTNRSESSSSTPPASRDKSTPQAVASSRYTAKKAKSPSLDELLMFYPSRYPDGDWKPKGLNFEDVWFRAEDGTRLHGWYCPCDKPRAIVLFAHGNAGNLSHRASRMQYLQKDLRVTVFIFDYRGYGRSEGVPTVEGILQDARAARAWLAHRAAVQQSQIVLMGRSLGGAVVVQLAAESPARGLVLESTFSSFKDVAAHHYPRLAWLAPANKLDSAAQIGRHKGPLLQSHGDKDGTVPHALGLKLFHAANDPKWFVTIRGGDHNDPQSAEYYKQLDRFLDALSGG
jgi:fermentation-respiration switch protein FrsA (DUF1100 family)